MIFLVELKNIENKIPTFFNKIDVISNTTWFVKNKKLTTYDGVYYLNNKVNFYNLNPYILDLSENNITIISKDIPANDKTIEIYQSKYNEFEKLIVVNGIISAFKVKYDFNLKNIIFGMKNPYLYIINNIIVSKKQSPDHEKVIESVMPTNIVKSLQTINDISGKGKWFVTTKIDGLTSVLCYLKNENLILIYSLIGQKINDKSKLLLKINTPDDLYNSDVCFLGEWFKDNLFLFLEANELYDNFRIDYKNMKLFVENCEKNNIKNIFINNIIISKSNEDYKDITKKILDVKVDKIDGYVYGNIKTKIHYKWKPVEYNTIDFYIIIKDEKIYFYAAEVRYKAFNRLAKDKKYIAELRKLEGKSKINTEIIIESPDNRTYVKQLFTINNFDKHVWLDKYNDKIIECKLINNMWYPFRIRDDKVFPQNYRVAESILWTINHPISLKDLY